MSLKLLTEQCLEFLSLNGGCTGLSEATLVKMPHCWKSRVMAQLSDKNRCFLLYVIIYVPPLILHSQFLT